MQGSGWERREPLQQGGQRPILWPLYRGPIITHLFTEVKGSNPPALSAGLCLYVQPGPSWTGVGTRWAEDAPWHEGILPGLQGPCEGQQVASVLIPHLVLKPGRTLGTLCRDTAQHRTGKLSVPNTTPTL